MSLHSIKGNILFLTGILYLFFCTNILSAQNEECHLIKSASGKIYTVDSFDILCLAETSKKEKTMVFTFGTWCKPCRYHLPDAIMLAKEYDLEFFVLLTDEENSQREVSAITYLQNIMKTHQYNFDVFILKDENGIPKKKYRKFLRQLTPSKFEYTEGMSKYIVIDKNGEVLMVTNWKDRQDKHWKDDSLLIQNRLIPVLE